MRIEQPRLVHSNISFALIGISSKVPHTPPFWLYGGFEKVLVFKDEGCDEIHDNGRSESEKRKINEVHTDTRGSYSEFIAQPRANTE